MIDMTSRAVEKMKQVVAEQNDQTILGIRVAVEAGGCSGFQYAMKVERDPQVDDQVIERDGLKVIVDEQSLMYLDGTQIDYESSWKGEGFRFKNPNVTGTCGCGESFSA
ncbi:MAG TPA: iron-sulfur cluster assembly accessory protein [Acidobacteriota bacterium]|nr:iron-sulfur cluster assembly accessory protein [Acidobacteriota bacterium]